MIRAILILTFALGFGFALAEARKPPEPIPTADLPAAVSPVDGPVLHGSRFALAATNTTVLASYTFDVGATCDAQGWTVVDATAQIAVFWHVDDFAGANVNVGDSYAPLAGTKSLWCGIRATSTGFACGYLALPGYGNNWNQTWQTKACIPVTGDLDVSFLMDIDSEASYDATFIEYTTECVNPTPLSDWDLLDGGIGEWDGIQSITHTAAYAVTGSPAQVRLRFASDGGFADDDGFYDSHSGPVVIDNLQVEGLALEDFEGESVTATEANDWEADIIPGYGAFYMALFPGASLVQQEVCAKNLSCVWAAIAGSTETYACGGFPQQAAVPKGNADGQYINAEIWSPLIPLAGSGSVINYQFDVYRDFTLDGLVFYTWAVRSLEAGCEGPWRDRNFAIFPGSKGWLRNISPVGDLIPATATHVRVRLGVIDQCGVWCGVIGTGACHSHAPLFDSVKVYRVEIVGPIWSTRDIDMFQDTFPADGSDNGIERADIALSITAQASPTILPGDSARVICSDPITAVPVTNPSGLMTDNLGGTGNQSGTNGNKACYLYVHVIDSGVPSITKTGAVLSGGPEYPFKDTVVANGKTWTRIQCWLRVSSTSTFVVDLNDNLFEAGDVVEFFFGATNTNGQTSYCSGSSLTYVQSDIELAAEAASEFTILPLDGYGDALYVDGMDGRGAQVYWDSAFEQIGVVPDRYDVRGPSSGVGNRPGTRVTDVAQQLNTNYSAIVWDCGDLSTGLGDGSGSPEKSNDYAMLNQFLNGIPNWGGVYISGDDAPSSLLSATGAAATTFRSTYITYSLTTSDHRPSFGVSPVGIASIGNALHGQSFVIFGGCPLLNDFDVMTPVGTSVMQMGYGTPAATNGAVVSKFTGNARVFLSGFSLIYIRDDEADGYLDRAVYLHRILRNMNVGSPGIPTQAPLVFVDQLEQNYPNPFNPQTTIAFSLKERARVRVDVFNVAGQLVKTLLDETRPAGSHQDVRWDGRDAGNRPAASGVYFYRLSAGDFLETRKMVLLK